MIFPIINAEPTPLDFDAACKVFEEDCLLTAYATALAKLRVALAALDTAKRSILNGQPAITCTVWADGWPAETLADYIDSAVTKITGIEPSPDATGQKARTAPMVQTEKVIP